MTVFAAGSLRRAFSRMADAYQSVYGQSIDFVFGPAGLLREAIERGQKPDLFASANTAHPEKLLDSGWAYRTFPFARNALGLTVRSSALTAGMHWLDALTNPKLRIGISTPGNDPSGDYALELFSNIEKTHPGVGNWLKERSLWLAGGKRSAIPAGEPAGAYLIRTGQADVFVGYKSGAVFLRDPSLTVLAIPDTHNVYGVYGIALLNPAGERFGEFILNLGKPYLQESGFMALPEN